MQGRAFFLRADDIVLTVTDHDNAGLIGQADGVQRVGDDLGLVGAGLVKVAPQMAVKYCARSKCSMMRRAYSSGLLVASTSWQPRACRSASSAGMPGVDLILKQALVWEILPEGRHGAVGVGIVQAAEIVERIDQRRAKGSGAGWLRRARGCRSCGSRTAPS